MMMRIMMMDGDLMIRRIVSDLVRAFYTVYLYCGLLGGLDILGVAVHCLE